MPTTTSGAIKRARGFIAGYHVLPFGKISHRLPGPGAHSFADLVSWLSRCVDYDLSPHEASPSEQSLLREEMVGWGGEGNSFKERYGPEGGRGM